MVVADTISNTLLILSVRKRSVLQGVAFPSLIIVSSDLVIRGELVGGLEEGVQLGVRFVASIASLIAFVYLAIIVHRVVLIGSNSIPSWGIRAWGKRETSFFLHSIGVWFAIIVPWLFLTTLVVPLDSKIPMNLRFLPVLLIIARLSLVFPSIAINQKLSFRESWRLTKEHKFLVLFLVGVMPLLINLPAHFIPETLIGTIFGSIFGCATTVVTVALLSKTFELCIGQSNSLNSSQLP